jgi:hypothetical protein
MNQLRSNELTHAAMRLAGFQFAMPSSPPGRALEDRKFDDAAASRDTAMP